MIHSSIEPESLMKVSIFFSIAECCISVATDAMKGIDTYIFIYSYF